MLRHARRKLRLIRYYSAPRPQTAWTRATDVALLASLLLAVPAAWLANLAIERQSDVASAYGQFFRMDDASVEAVVLSVSDRRPSLPDGKPMGNFQITVVRDDHGWPLVTSQVQQPARVDIDILSEVKARKNVKLAPDDPLRLAMEHALDAEDCDLAVSAMSQDGPRTHNHWFTWAASAGLWWIMLAFASWFAISVARFGWLIASGKIAGRKAQLRAEGKCTACGYDMTGLDFNERCPECGALVW
jgi:hypothetical protein